MGDLRRGVAATHEHLLKKATELIQQKKWVEAREMLVALDTLYPPDAEVLWGLAKVHRELGNKVGAEEAAARLDKLEKANRARDIQARVQLDEIEPGK